MKISDILEAKANVQVLKGIPKQEEQMLVDELELELKLTDMTKEEILAEIRKLKAMPEIIVPKGGRYSEEATKAKHHKLLLALCERELQNYLV